MRGESQRQQKGYECSMEPSENSWPEARKRRMRGRIGVLHESARKVWELVGEAAVGVDGADYGQAFGQTKLVVVLAEAWGNVDDAGAVVGGYKVGCYDAESTLVGMAGEVGEQRLVAQPDEVFDGDRRYLGDFAVVSAEEVFDEGGGEDQLFSVAGGDAHVVDVAADGQAHVGGQGPRGRRPSEQGQARLAGDAEAHCDRRVLSVLVALVDLKIRQRCGAAGDSRRGICSPHRQGPCPTAT